jgi:type IV secretory pathway VirB4 component
VEAEYRKALMGDRRAEMEALRNEQRRRPFLPPGGESGPMAGRSYRRLRLVSHRATSEVLAGAYPFLAEEGLGSAGMLIGQDGWSGAAFCYDPWELYRQGALTNPNVCLAGQIGRGKSTLAKSLAARCIAFGRRVYVPGDPKGEWSVVTRALGGQAVELGVGTSARLNPLDDGPRPSGVNDASWQAQVRSRRLGLLAALAEATVGRALRATERTALDTALDTAQTKSSTPILPMVVDAMLEPERPFAGSTVDQLRTDGRETAHALARLVRGDLAGLFDGPSTVHFDPGLPMLSLDLSGVSGSDTLMGLVMTCASTWMEAALADPSGGQRLVVYDEAWRLLAQPVLLARMQAQWKLSRAWGLANLIVLHRLSDLDAVGDIGSEARGLAQGLLGDTATRILYNEPFEEAQAAGKVLGLTSVEIDQLPELARGEGLWRVNERAFVVRHICTPDELTLFDTDARMLAK